MPRAEIARRLHPSRNADARYADMEDLSPEPPVPAGRPRPAIGQHAAWIDAVLEADLGEPRKQRHTARRIYDRLVAERGYEGFADMDAHGYLDRLLIREDHQRRGIASALCDALERGAAGRLITVRSSITARPFFEARGYIVKKERKVERAGVFLTCYDMEKRIELS